MFGISLRWTIALSQIILFVHFCTFRAVHKIMHTMGDKKRWPTQQIDGFHRGPCVGATSRNRPERESRAKSAVREAPPKHGKGGRERKAVAACTIHTSQVYSCGQFCIIFLCIQFHFARYTSIYARFALQYVCGSDASIHRTLCNLKWCT